MKLSRPLGIANVTFQLALATNKHDLPQEVVEILPRRLFAASGEGLVPDARTIARIPALVSSSKATGQAPCHQETTLSGLSAEVDNSGIGADALPVVSTNSPIGSTTERKKLSQPSLKWSAVKRPTDQPPDFRRITMIVLLKFESIHQMLPLCSSYANAIQT